MSKITEMQMKIAELLQANEAAMTLVEQLTAERDALAAQVAELQRHIANVSRSYKDSSGYEPSISVFHRSLDEAVEAANATPQQNIVEIRSQAGRAGFVAGYSKGWNDFGGDGSFRRETLANQYSDSIRRGEVM